MSAPSLENSSPKAHSVEKLRTRRLVQSLALSYSLLIVYVIYLSNLGLRGVMFKIVHIIPFGDHGAHFLLIGLLTLLIGASAKWQTWRLLSVDMLSSSWILFFVMGLEEALQNFCVNRSPELYDLLGNCLGVIVFDWIAQLVHASHALDYQSQNLNQGACIKES